MGKAKNRALSNSIYKACGYGTIISVAVSLLLGVLVSVFIINEYLEITSAQHYMTITRFISVFLGAYLAGKIANQKRLLSSAVVGGISFVIQMSCAILFFDGVTVGWIAMLIADALGSGIAILLVTRTKKGVLSRRKRSVAR